MMLSNPTRDQRPMMTAVSVMTAVRMRMKAGTPNGEPGAGADAAEQTI